MALECLVPELEKLERLLVDANSETLQALEDFASHPDLRRVAELLEDANAQAAEFNPFEVLDLWWQEDIHSRILTWLLGPNNSHGLGDYFLRHLLLISGSLSSAGARKDWSYTKSQREWNCVVDGENRRLDILLVNAREGFLCAIENKIFAPEGGRQLTRYRRALEAEYSNFERHYIFLSPNGMESRWEEERKLWTPMRYSTILQLVDQTIDDNAAVMREEVRRLLRQYAATLRRRIVPETDEIAKQARKIYVEHREIIELIYRHKPDYQAEMNQILQDAIRQHGDWLLDDTNTKYVRFCPTKWQEFGCFRTGTGWPSKAVILFEFYCTPRNTHFSLVLAPSKESVRSVLFERIKQDSRVFNYARGMLKDDYQHVHRQRNILNNSDLNNWYDTDSLGPAKLRQYLADFAQNDFPAMNEIIVGCLSEYEKRIDNQ